MQLHCNHQPIKATIILPGSKSISNRLLILNEVLNLNLQIANLSDSKDTADLHFALHSKSNTIDIGHAGTDMRFLTALLSIKKGKWILTGSERMKERPIKELVDALIFLGADIHYLEKKDFPPLKISGKELNGGEIEIESGVSSQFISALLLIAPSLKNGLKITLKGKTVSWSYIKMTIGLLKQYGINVQVSDKVITVEPNHPELTYPENYEVESDWSSASYWYGIVALAKNAEIKLKTFYTSSLQGDSVLPEIYKKLGVTTKFINNELILIHNGNCSSYFKYDFTDCPDLTQTIAVTCLGLGIDCYFSGLSTLKHKETDRLIAMKKELEKFGATVLITDDTLKLINAETTRNLKPETITINTYNDHRMAMSFAPLAILFDNLIIENPGVVEKSYPQFWNHLSDIGINYG